MTKEFPRTSVLRDEELIARLRDGCNLQQKDGESAANRIEALIADRDAAEAKLAKALEALEALIQQTHDCEKELTEGLHHVDFCGESAPLTNARAALAEIKGESHE